MFSESSRDQEDVCKQDATVKYGAKRGFRKISIYHVVSVIVFPLFGPLSLLIFGVEDDLGELFVVICTPIIYLILGMAVSSFSLHVHELVIDQTDFGKIRKRLHNLRVGSLFFLALFEAAISMYIVGKGIPLSVIIVAVAFYLLYVVLGILWIKGLNKMKIKPFG